jgi:hypothetical protein
VGVDEQGAELVGRPAAGAAAPLHGHVEAEHVGQHPGHGVAVQAKVGLVHHIPPRGVVLSDVGDVGTWAVGCGRTAVDVVSAM